AERARKLLELLLRQDPADRPEHMGSVSRGLRPVHAGEEQALLEALKKAGSEDARVLVLNLVAAVPLSAASFPAVTPWLDRTPPQAVRRAAIEALPRLDAYRAASALAPLLSVNEPELGTVLACLVPGYDSSAPGLFNARAAEGLFLLARPLRHAVFEGNSAR